MTSNLVSFTVQHAHSGGRFQENTESALCAASTCGKRCAGVCQWSQGQRVVPWSELSHWYEHIYMLILTVGDTPSTDDQVFVCQLGSVIEVCCGARITISYVFAPFLHAGATYSLEPRVGPRPCDCGGVLYMWLVYI